MSSVLIFRPFDKIGGYCSLTTLDNKHQGEEDSIALGSDLDKHTGKVGYKKVTVLMDKKEVVDYVVDLKGATNMKKEGEAHLSSRKNDGMETKG